MEAVLEAQSEPSGCSIFDSDPGSRWLRRYLYNDEVAARASKIVREQGLHGASRASELSLCLLLSSLAPIGNLSF